MISSRSITPALEVRQTRKGIEMTCHGFLVEFPNQGPVCIPIYREPLRWPPHDPDPRVRIIDDIRVLVAIHEGVARISDGQVRERLAQAVQAAAGAVSLPHGVTLGDGLFKASAGTAG